MIGCAHGMLPVEVLFKRTSYLSEMFVELTILFYAGRESGHLGILTDVKHGFILCLRLVMKKILVMIRN